MSESVKGEISCRRDSMLWLGAKSYVHTDMYSGAGAERDITCGIRMKAATVMWLINPGVISLQA